MLSFSRDGMNCFKVKNESDVSVCGHTKIKRWAKRKQFSDGPGISLCHQGVVSFLNGGGRGDSGNDLQAGAAYKV